MSRRLPVCTLILVAASLGSSITPEAATQFEYDRARVTAGEIWRPVTGQLVHWSAGMAALDLAATAIAGALVERRSRSSLLAVVAASMAAVGATVHLWTREIDRYRGLSGVASALFVAACLSLAAGPARGLRRLGWLALAIFAVKLLGDVALGGSLVSEVWPAAAWSTPYLPPGVEALPVVHLVGALTGAVALYAVRKTVPKTPTARAPTSAGT